MIASGSALTAASLAFSYATPVHTLSPVRPLRPSSTPPTSCRSSASS